MVALGAYFLWGAKNAEWPNVNRVDRFTSRLGIPQPYYEPSLGRIVEYRARTCPLGHARHGRNWRNSGFFGLGAGWAMVPALTMIVGVPLKVAAAASHMIIGMGNCISVWPYILIGADHSIVCRPMVAGQVLGGIVGAQALHKGPFASDKAHPSRDHVLHQLWACN